MLNFLSKLDLGSPCMRSKFLFTIIALHKMLKKLNNKTLLHCCIVHNLLLNSYLYLNSSRMRFCPNERSIHYLYFIQTFYLFQTKRKKFTRFPLTITPWRSVISLTISTKIQNSLLCYPFCPVRTVR